MLFYSQSGHLFNLVKVADLHYNICLLKLNSSKTNFVLKIIMKYVYFYR